MSDLGASVGGFSPSLDQNRQSQSVEGSLALDLSGLVALTDFKSFISDSNVSSRVCTDAWAVRHALVNDATGEVVRLNCDRYECMYCGPRRVAVWRDVIELAQPERFITLSSMGDTLVEASNVLTRVVRRLRRNGYQVQYLATFEQHRNGRFHAHLLQKGDYIPQGFLCDALRTATHGASFITNISRARPDCAGYVTKYVTKSLAGSAVGRKSDGSRARPNRIRYSREFFPAPTAALREYKRNEYLDKLRAEGELIEDDSDQAGEWHLIEQHELPRLPGGRVDRAAADDQYQRLVMSRLAEQDLTSPARLSRGARVGLLYMLRENVGEE